MPTRPFPASQQPTGSRLLVVDDEVELLTALGETLSREGFEVVGATSGNEALTALREQPPFDLLLTDLMMPGLDGLALLKAALEIDPQLVGVMMTGQGTVQTAVDAMKVGAFDYVLKPFKLSAMLPVLKRAVEARRLRVENLQLRETVAIYELAQTLAYTLDADVILAKLADAALQQSEADEASVMLPAPEGEGLVVAAARGAGRGYLAGERVPLATGIPGWVARFRELLELKGEVQDPRFSPLHPRPEIRHALCVPMLAGNDFVGVLNVNVTRPRRPFTLRDAKALSILAGLGAAALQNARLLAQVQADEKRFRALIKNASDAITLLGPDGTVRYDSPAAQGLLGYGPEELLGTNAFERIHPDDWPTTQAVLQRLVATPGAKLLHTFRFRHKSGEWRWLEAVGSNLLAEPSVQAIVVNYRDITKRRAAQDALRESEDRYRDLIEHIHDLICTHDLEGQILSANQSAFKMLGYEPHELAGKNLRDILAPEVRHEFDNYLSTIRQKGAAHGLMLVETRSGERRIWEYDNSLRTEGVSAPIVRGFARDITERRRAEAALRESEARQRLILNSVDEAIYSTEQAAPNSLESRVRFVSDRAEQILGYQPREFMNDPALWFSLLHPDDAPATREQTVAIFASRQPGTRVYRVRHKHTGEYRWIEDRVAPQVDKSGNVIGTFGVARDITERKRAEAELAALYHASARLVAPRGNPAELAEEIARAVTREFALADCGVMLVSEDGKELLRLARAGDYEVTANANLKLDGSGLTVAAVRSGEVIYAPEVTANPLYMPGESRTRSELVVPLYVGGEVIGVLDLQSPQPDAFDERARRLVSVFAERAAIALHNARLDEAQARRAAELSAIALVSSALRTATTRAEMLPIILDQLLDLMKVGGVAFGFRDPLTGETVIELARGEWASWTGIRLSPGEGVSGHVFATGRPYLNNDVRSDPRMTHLDQLSDLRAVACIPLIARQQTIGALWMGRRTDIAEGEVRLLNAIADITANAIHRAALHEQTERSVQRLIALHTIDTTITASFDLRLTLNVLLDQVTTHLGVDAAAVLLLNPHLQTLEYAAGRGFRSPAIKHLRLRLGEGHAGRAALERRTLSIPNLAETEDFAYPGWLADEGFVAYYAVPLIAKGYVKGVLEVFHRAPLDPDPEWLNFLETLAGQAAIAIDNTELFDGLQRSNVELALAYDATIEGWSRALDLRDKETEGHTQRVTELTLRLAREMGIDDAELVHIRRGALLHDIGKMGIPDSILLKPGPLSDEEWAIMKKHPAFAFDMLSPIVYLQRALDIPYYHHEKWDGTGYPRGLKGERIPLAARIFAVVDVYDALRSDRPYRPGWSEQKVREYIREQAGQHFDPQVIELFLTITATDETRGSTPS